MVSALGELRVRGRVLVVDDPRGSVEEQLRAMGVEAVPWRRRLMAERSAEAWPPDASYDGALLRLPRDWASFEMQLHALAARLPTGAPLWVFGAKDEGIVTAGKRLAPYFEGPRTLRIQKRCRVLEACRAGHSEGLRGRLEDWAETVALQIPAGPDEASGEARELALWSWPGAFAHGRLDPGTAALLRSLPDSLLRGSVLDFGCGIGLIARVLSDRVPGLDLWLIDNDAVSIHAAKRNLSAGRHLLGAGLRPLRPGDRFELIVSNPPFHPNKSEDLSVIRELIERAPAHLSQGGSLVVVSKRSAGLGRLMRDHFAEHELLGEDPRYGVWRGARARRPPAGLRVGRGDPSRR
jgi:16S rRNA (guanine1207-N2)-methyltransferase